jgi:hypothetical protein
MREMTLTYPKRLWELWKSENLYEAWYWENEGLFDEKDLAQARSFVPKGHYYFGEWFTAIHFHRQGWKVLNEMYVLRTHRKKRAILSRVLGRKAFALITGDKLDPPDLFVYDSETGIYFFVEVKLESDRLRDNQRRSFQRIEKRMSCQVLIVKLKGR